MRPETAQLLTTLPTLPKQDLAVIRAAVERLLTRNIPNHSQLYELLAEITASRMPFSRFLNSSYSKGFSDKEAAFEAFIRDTWAEPRQVLAKPLRMFLIGLLVADLKSRNIPIKLGVLVVNLDAVPDVFEKNFPDYRESGLANAILTSMVSK